MSNKYLWGKVQSQKIQVTFFVGAHSHDVE